MHCQPYFHGRGCLYDQPFRHQDCVQFQPRCHEGFVCTHQPICYEELVCTIYQLSRHLREIVRTINHFVMRTSRAISTISHEEFEKHLLTLLSGGICVPFSAIATRGLLYTINHLVMIKLCALPTTLRPSRSCSCALSKRFFMENWLSPSSPSCREEPVHNSDK